MRRVAAYTLAGLSLLALGGCLRHEVKPNPQASVSTACNAGETAMQHSTLYLGAAIPDSIDTVDAGEWQRFLDTSVTPRFPVGLTWLDARGQWRGNDGRVIGEPSRVLILLHPDEREARAAIETIRTEYQRAFAQEAVMLERWTSCVAF